MSHDPYKVLRTTPEPSVGFDWDAIDCNAPDAPKVKEAADVGLEDYLSFLVEGADAKTAQERLQILAYRMPGVRGRATSYRELACRLGGISHEGARKRVDREKRRFAQEITKLRCQS